LICFIKVMCCAVLCCLSGLLCDLSDRPLLCSAARWEAAEVVVGSADHALYVVDVRNCKQKRKLYTKTMGHTE
jgi:hypothetical protein